MGVLWGHFKGILKIAFRYSGVTSGLLSGHFGGTQGLLLGHFGSTLGSLWEYSWVTLGVLLGHFGVLKGWNYFRGLLNSLFRVLKGIFPQKKIIKRGSLRELMEIPMN